MDLDKSRVLIIHIGPQEDSSLFEELSKEYPQFTFLAIQDPTLLDHSVVVSAVPCVTVLHRGVQLNTFDGDSYLLDAHQYLTTFAPDVEKAMPNAAEIEDALLYNKNVVFLNGSLQFPLDATSKLIAQRIKKLELHFVSIDLPHENAKFKRNLFYSNGELVVIGNEEFMNKNDAELSQLFKQPIEKRLEKLINKAPIMLFMKGDRHVQKCGFSRQILSLLEHDCPTEFETFDILRDEEVRNELKKYSNWPTYPQLYVKGELIGGLDICKELAKTGELAKILSQ